MDSLFVVVRFCYSFIWLQTELASTLSIINLNKIDHCAWLLRTHNELGSYNGNVQSAKISGQYRLIRSSCFRFRNLFILVKGPTLLKWYRKPSSSFSSVFVLWIWRLDSLLCLCVIKVSGVVSPSGIRAFCPLVSNNDSPVPDYWEERGIVRGKYYFP